MLDKKGGYLIINYSEKGAYEKLTRSNKKVVLLTGLEENAQWMSVYTGEDSYVLVNENYVIGIDDEDNFIKDAGLYQGYTSANASTKKIYWHTLNFVRKATTSYYLEGYMIILTDSDEIIDVDKFIELIGGQGFYGVVINGKYEQTVGAISPSSSSTELVAIRSTSDEDTFSILFRDNDNVINDTTLAIVKSQWTINDLGVNAIN